MIDLFGHLISRRISASELIRQVHVSPACATFMLWNLSGQMVGYQEYRPGMPKAFSKDRSQMRYFTYVSPGQVGVYGLETVSFSDDVVYVAEGIFDAAALHWIGKPAIAVLSNDPKHLRSFLRILPQRKIAVCDGDDAGRKLANLCDSHIMLPPGDDPASLQSSHLRYLLSCDVRCK